MRWSGTKAEAGLILGAICMAAAGLQAQANASQAQMQMVTVAPGVRLEVLDWGGPKTGRRALVFLAGLGLTAHEFDGFAPQFTAQYHVYAITRRGFGASSRPVPTDANYSAERLGEDVVAAIDAMGLVRPVLVGHSIAGEELSWVGSHAPQKVAGLIYLDAADSYAYDAHVSGDWWMEMLDLRHRTDELRQGAVLDADFMQGMLANSARLREDSAALEGELAAVPHVPPAPAAIPLAVMFGEEEFSRILAPALAIFACPHRMRSLSLDVSAANAAAERLVAKLDAEHCTAQAAAFETGNPADPVVRIANADHAVFLSNPTEVVRAMNDFLAHLPAK